MNDNNFSPLAWVLIAAVICAVIGNLFGNNAGTMSAPAASSSAERRYVEQRFRQEGYSAKDSATAADAVLKFHRAQEARKNR